MKKTNTEFLKVCKSLNIDPATIPQIMSVEDAFKALGRKIVLPQVKGIPKKHQKYIIADYSLVIISEALNMDVNTKKEWSGPNWNDANEYKYQPYFCVKASNKKPSGFGFSYSDFDHWFTHTDVGSRLCFRNSDRCRFAQKQFEKLFLERTLILK